MTSPTNTTQSAEQLETIKKYATRQLDAASHSLKAHYEKLVKLANAHDGFNSIGRQLEYIAKTEGEQKAYILILEHVDHCPLHEIIADRLLEGANDSWSGRNNDAQRSFHEGLIYGFQRAKNWIA